MKIKLLLLSILLISCNYKKINVNLNEYQPLPPLNYEAILPGQPFDDWTLFFSDLSFDSIIYSSGHFKKDHFKDIQFPKQGFNFDCLPICFFEFIITSKSGETNIWDTQDSLKLFLGSIDNISEAQLLASGLRYYFKNESIYKSTDNGFRVTMFKLVKTGMPIQVDKFLLDISKNGKIKIIGREVFSKKENAII